jgi:hypothetical protein
MPHVRPVTSLFMNFVFLDSLISNSDSLDRMSTIFKIGRASRTQGIVHHSPHKIPNLIKNL